MEGRLVDFFISYTADDRQWASWIATALHDAGYGVTLQDWDFKPGMDWVHEMHSATCSAQRTIAVLSGAYLRSVHGEAEWRAAYREDPSGELGLLVPVRVDRVRPPGLLGTRVYIDLVDMDEPRARRVLIDGVRQATAGRRDPMTALDPAPDFPGAGVAGGRPDGYPADPVRTSYQRAVTRQYQDPPYFSVRGERRLSDLYIDQFLERAGPNGSADHGSSAGSFRMTAIDLINGTGNALIEGGPGAGKSSLVSRIAMLALGREAMTPAVVRARALSEARGTFTARLREAVAADLGGKLADPLPDDFFATSGGNGSILVIVDALDEIVDSRSRARLVEDILYLAGTVDPPIRFIVTTRPIVDTVNHAWPEFARLRLVPLDDRQIAGFAQCWFTSTGDSGARTAAEFVREIERRSVGDLLGNPLLLTIAATVFGTAGRHTLPNSRVELYRAFLATLEDEEDERGTRVAFRHMWDRHLGQRGKAAADDLFSSRYLIMEHLALWRQAAAVTSMVEETARYLTSEWEGRDGVAVDRDWLERQAAVLLQRSALVVPSGPDHEFIHETVREYLAATALIHGGLYSDTAGAVDIVLRWRQTAWRTIVAFLLGIWSIDGYDVRNLLRAVEEGSPDGVVFTASVIAEGTRVDDETRTRCIAGLGRYCHSLSWAQVLFDDPNPFRALAALGDTRCAEELTHIASDRTIEVMVRAYAAEMLGELPARAETVEVLVSLSGDNLETAVRYGAGVALGNLGETELAIPILEKVVADDTVAVGIRQHAIEALGGQDAIAALLRIAASEIEPSLQERAASVLESRGHVTEASAILRALAEDNDVDAQVRINAVVDLGRGNELALLRELGHRPGVDDWIREFAARAVGQCGDVRTATELLRSIADSPRVDERVRLRAVQGLCDIGDADGLEKLTDDASPRIRLAAISSLPRNAGRDRHLDYVRRLAVGAPGTDDAVRREAADVLVRIGVAAEGLAALTGLARAGDVPSWIREEAVLSLCAGRHTPQLRDIARDAALPAWLRISAWAALLEDRYRITAQDHATLAELSRVVEPWQWERLEEHLAATRNQR